MPRRRSLRLVVDTDVARAASTRDHPRADACRAVLDAIRDVCHRVVLSPRQDEEWRAHRSRFTGTWLISMAARRKWIVLEADPDSGLTGVIEALPVSDAAKEAMRKDAHLLEMALATDHRVISMDETAYRHFAGAVARLHTCRAVHWANPLRNSDDVVGWLARGAPDERLRHIGQRPPEHP